jgi:hypothetical protein
LRTLAFYLANVRFLFDTSNHFPYLIQKKELLVPLFCFLRISKLRLGDISRQKQPVLFSTLLSDKLSGRLEKLQRTAAEQQYVAVYGSYGGH